jgi:2-haloacid dehalogenase
MRHVAQSVYHDHEPPRAVGLPCVWIDRRGDRTAFGATPQPRQVGLEPTWRYQSLAAFADDAVTKRAEARTRQEWWRGIWG